jgi:hypothetical protein
MRMVHGFAAGRRLALALAKQYIPSRHLASFLEIVENGTRNG